jgi:4-hydroxybenzoate polyprenyltransferase
MNKVKNYLSLIKFSHTIFALPFAMIGFILGVVKDSKIQHHVSGVERYGYKFLLVLVCMITARSAAMAFNRYLDRSFDALNPRTAIREIPKGLISANAALRFVIVNVLVFIAACWFINKLCFYLSFIAIFVVLFYSFTKRFTALCHLVLGIGLSLAPVGAYLAVTAQFALVPILFGCLVLCWVSGFDIIYALQDEQFDKQHQLHSIPAYLGKKNALLVSRLLHTTCAFIVIAIGILSHANLLYILGSISFVTLLFYQQSIVSATNLSRVNLAFMTANGIASIIFSVFVITEQIISYLL